MLARRRTASLADAVIRLHNVAPPPHPTPPTPGGGCTGRRFCSKCRRSRLIHPFKNIDLFISGGGGGVLAVRRAQTKH